jgi:galactokinase
MAELRAFAPGRVNLIGEHTDYEDGLCLPFAIAQGVTVTAEPTGGREVVVEAADLGEADRFAIGEERPAPNGWRAFVRGAAAELSAAGHEVRPCRLRIEADLPRDAGLSSSAALTVAVCLALLGRDDDPDRVALARLCSRVENDWAGQRTGLLDQLASLLGRDGRALRIDMRGPELRHVPLELGGHRLAVLDSGAPRALAASGYNERRAECLRARELLGVEALRDAPPDPDLPEPLASRVRHVVEENARVDAAAAALEAGDPARLGALLGASHASLRDLFDASTPEVERAVEACRAAGAIGARMVGGGFGGSVLALFPPGGQPPPGALAVEARAGARLL